MQTTLNGIYSTYSNEELLNIYQKAPGKIKDSITGLSYDEVTREVVPAKWSIAEIVCHLADAELVASSRLRQTITQSDPDFAYYDEAVWARKLQYNKNSEDLILMHLELFKILRKINLKLFERLKKDDWQNIGYHPKRGPLSLRNLLELYADHGERHLEQIVERRRLIGKPLNVLIELPVRLY
jgi:uncharacterized damage-inducible protein DinB